MKNVLITGVSGGVGEATARLFHDSGWRVFGIDSREFNSSVALENFWLGDVAEPELWKDVAASADLCQGLDALVNNAAIQLNKSLLDTSLEEWQGLMNVNLTSSFLSTKYLAPLMEGREAAIVNVSSVHALQTSPNIAAYAVSKGGLIALTRTAALELSEKSIRVNAVLPGAVNTKMLEDGLSRGHIAVDEIESMKQTLADNTPCGRVGEADEIAKAIFFLCDNSCSSFITGQTLIVDGGALAKLSTE